MIAFNVLTSADPPTPPATLEEIRRICDKLASAFPAAPFDGLPVRVVESPHLPPDWLVVTSGPASPLWLVQVDEAGHVLKMQKLDPVRPTWQPRKIE